MLICKGLYIDKTFKQCVKLSTSIYFESFPYMAESEKDGELRNQVPEEGFKSEEGCVKSSIFYLISSEFSISVQIMQDISRKYDKISLNLLFRH